MHRLIVGFEYLPSGVREPFGGRKSSADPENRLLWRFNRRRMEAEAIRDSILYVSGRLNQERGGPGIFPPLPDDLADFARYGRTGRLMWEPNESEPDGRRRSIYIFQRRSLPLPDDGGLRRAGLQRVLSEPQESRPRRCQALSMLNGSVVREAAHLAEAVETEAGPDRGARIALAFKRVLNRSPEPEEVDAFLAFPGDLEGTCRVLLNSNEFLYID